MLTPGFASPEQIAGLTMTTASDIYQLGLLLQRLMTVPDDDEVWVHMPRTVRADLAKVIARHGG